MTLELPFEPTLGFDRVYGLEIDEIADGLVRGRVQVRDDLKQPAGLVHGGVYAAIAESLATNGTAAMVHADGNAAMGLSNQTSFLRPVTAGSITPWPAPAIAGAPPGSGRSSSPTTTAGCAR